VQIFHQVAHKAVYSLVAASVMKVEIRSILEIPAPAGRR
jgi:hypothetical protein